MGKKKWFYKNELKHIINIEVKQEFKIRHKSFLM